jgi:hypothetical protein
MSEIAIREGVRWRSLRRFDILSALSLQGGGFRAPLHSTSLAQVHGTGQIIKLLHRAYVEGRCDVMPCASKFSLQRRRRRRYVPRYVPIRHTTARVHEPSRCQAKISSCNLHCIERPQLYEGRAFLADVRIRGAGNTNESDRERERERQVHAHGFRAESTRAAPAPGRLMRVDRPARPGLFCWLLVG